MSEDCTSDIAIIGAGFAGVCTAVKLKQAGIHEFVVYERSPSAGGTWLDNTYPGCEVDVNSQIYSLSFMPYDWSSSYARAGEVRQYIEDIIDRFAIRSHFRFSTLVETAMWDEIRGRYRLRLSSGEESEHAVVVCGVGFLSEPKYPTFPGLDEFSGTTFHTAQWDHDHDLTGKRVALIGTGSTAIQAATQIAKSAANLYIFQREPAWIIPKPKREYSAFTVRRRQSWRWSQKVERFFQWTLFEIFLRNAFKQETPQNRLAQRLASRHIKQAIKDPALRADVTPAYPFGCKRVIFDGHFYNTLCRSNVQLIPHAVVKASEGGLEDACGQRHAVDTIVLATGFHAQKYLSSIKVRGRSGVDLHEFWGDRPRAMLGMTVPGFPNFCILYGPNTNGGNAITFQIERQTEVALRMIRKLRRSGYTLEIDTRRRTFERYTRWIDRENAKRFNTANHCNNYYFSPDGSNVTQWPRGSADYWLFTRLLMPLATTSRVKRDFTVR